MAIEPTLTFNGTVSADGKIQVAKSFREDVGRVFAGKKISVSVTRKKSKRSNRQNSYYWAVVVVMIRERVRELTGELWTNESIHDWLKVKFNSKEVIFNDVVEIIPMSSAGLMVGQFMDYLAKIRTWAMDVLDLDIPEPNSQTELALE